MPSRPDRIPAPQKSARRSLVTSRRRTQAERTEETRTRILKAASELIRRRGYARFRTADVAAEAGLSRGAQLHHFPTKDRSEEHTSNSSHYGLSRMPSSA